MQKFTLLSIILILCLTPQIQAERIRFGAYCDYFAPQDEMIKQLYGDGDALYGLRLNVLVFKGLQGSISYGQFKKFGTTSALNDITRLTLHPLTVGIRYTPPLGKVNPYFELAYLNLSYKEECDIGDHTGSESGWMMVGGLEFLLSKRFGLSLDLKYQQVEGSGDDEATQISFKGYSGGLSFFIRI